jgi:nucleoside-diphosphate-sugar epimerase
MVKRILLTGATGFLGSHLVKYFLAAGHEVVALKRRSSSLRRIASVLDGIALHDSDGSDFTELFKTAGHIDAIIHTATNYGRNGESISEVFSANTEFPLRLLDAGARAGVEIFMNTDTILDKYLNLYSLSKNQFLQWGRFFSKSDKIRFANIRLEHFYGADDEQTKFSAYVINSCLTNVGELNLTKGEQRRDFIHVDDVVSAYAVLLDKTDSFAASFAEFDVGSGVSISIEDFVRTVHRLSLSKTHLNFGALPYRGGEVMHSEANISALQAFGWRCKYDIETGLKLVIEQERGGV